MLELTNGIVGLRLQTQGAYITQLFDSTEQLLFPAQMIGQKLRGGIPVCAPIFGPGESVGLRQHGFARDVGWTVLRQTANEAVLSFDAAEHVDVPRQYHGCEMTYAMKIRENLLELSLTVENNGEAAFVCTPGFHPYFPTSDATKVTVQSDISRQFTEHELIATQFLPPHQTQVAVTLENIEFIIKSNELQRYAVWSANPDKYICVEPTLQGNLDSHASSPFLHPGEQKRFLMSVSWRGIR